MINEEDRVSDKERMKNRSFKMNVIVLCTLIFTGTSALAQANGFKATISQSEAAFEFPLDPNYEYSWNSGGLTYAWNVKTASPKCELGFFLFTAQGAGVTEEGDINKVLEAGQFSVFCGGRIRNDMKVSGFASEAKDKLTIVLTGAKSIKLLFGTKPKYVTFERVLELFEKPKVTRVAVAYGGGQGPAATTVAKATATKLSPTKELEILEIVSEGENAPEALLRVVAFEDLGNDRYKVNFAGGPCFRTSVWGDWYIVETNGETLKKDDLFYKVSYNENWALRRADARDVMSYMQCKWR